MHSSRQSETLEVIKQSKICLNSVPTYKSGTHERVLACMATGVVPITNDNLFLREYFADGEDIIFYRYPDLTSINDTVNALLANEGRRRAMAASAREKVMRHHTWDARADYLVEVLPDLIEKASAVYQDLSR